MCNIWKPPRNISVTLAAPQSELEARRRKAKFYKVLEPLCDESLAWERLVNDSKLEKLEAANANA